jgi:outer membrane protein OmpA-like peptidoglycan-associated protein
MKPFFTFLILTLLSTFARAQGSQDTLRVYFPFDEAVLTPEAQATLDSFITRYRGQEVPAALEIRGHCDALGSNAYNEVLAKRRTLTVHDYLLNKGLAKTAVAQATGFGERLPLNAGRTPDERRLNRRVEIIWSRETASAPPPPETPRTDTVPIFSRATMDTVKEGSTLRLRNINFYGGRHTFLPQAMPALDELVEVMKAYPTMVIDIQGHICCRYGQHEDGLDYDAGDMNLSHNRARAVYYYLAERGIDKRRMTYRGFAGNHPLVWPEESEADRTLNRRVEIRIVKK